jgi:transcriptional regulator GlxA family with amidase domain
VPSFRDEHHRAALLTAVDTYVARCFAFHERPQVEQLARRLGMSRSRLTILFRRSGRAAIGAYLRTSSIDNAKLLLRTSETSIADIAVQVGYRSERAFYRAFRRAARTTPAAYRDAFRLRAKLTRD